MSAPTVSPRLDGSVQGVGVQARKYTPPSAGNTTFSSQCLRVRHGLESEGDGRVVNVFAFPGVKNIGSVDDVLVVS
jgi:hypothetical protein